MVLRFLLVVLINTLIYPSYNRLLKLSTRLEPMILVNLINVPYSERVFQNWLFLFVVHAKHGNEIELLC